MAEDDWNLYDVVRGFKTATTTATGLSFNSSNITTQNYLSCLSKVTVDEDDAASFTLPSVVKPVNTGFRELQQACIQFIDCGITTTKANTNGVCGVDISISASSVCDLGGSIGRQQQPFQLGSPNLKPRIFHDQHHQQQQLHQFQIAQNNIGTCAVTLSNTSSETTKSRKRKSQQKRLVCHVPPAKLSSDIWAWRKYGQKPIKGSPHPRNYYRCSSSKGCAARKQVEQSTKDPELFVVTYTGEHTHPRPRHRNSLAGIIRRRLPSAPQKLDSHSFQLAGSHTVMNNNTNPSSSSPMPVSISPTSPATSSPPEHETQSRDMELEAAAAAEKHVLQDLHDVDGFADDDF